MSRPTHHTVPALLGLLGCLAWAGPVPARAADDVVLTPQGTLMDPAPVEDTAAAPETAPGTELAAIDDAAAQGAGTTLYVYGARTLRDPFMLPAEVRTPEQAREDVPPLERMPLSEFRLVAVIKKKGTNYAMVASSDGKGYTVGVGTRIGADGGEVRRIMADAVIVEQVRADEFGELKKSETVLGLRPEEVVP